MSLPAKITITQSGLAPRVVLAPGAVPAPPAGLPPYPLGALPDQTYNLVLTDGVLSWVLASTVPLAITAPASGVAGVAMAITGSVSPSADRVVFGLSLSPLEPPTGELVTALNIGGALSCSLTPPAAGTWYVWAIDTTAGTGSMAVSGAINVTANTVGFTINQTSTGSFAAAQGGDILVGGSIVPAQSVAMQVALSTSNTAAPTTGWQAVSANDGASWQAAVPVPATAGTYYVWVETTAGLGTIVSDFSITVV